MRGIGDPVPRLQLGFTAQLCQMHSLVHEEVSTITQAGGRGVDEVTLAGGLDAWGGTSSVSARATSKAKRTGWSRVPVGRGIDPSQDEAWRVPDRGSHRPS